MSESEVTDVLIVGAGPAGIQAACTAQELGLSHRIVDRRGLAHSYVEHPQTLRYFSPPDEMAVGGVPFPMRGGEKPAREDILPYFRAVAAYKNLNLSVWERIVAMRRDGEIWTTRTLLEPNHDQERTYRSRTVIISTGMWDVPNALDCPGAGLPHVATRLHEPTEYFGMDVVVIGGGNSALTGAMLLAEAHAKVTLAMRRAPTAYQSHLRPFVVRDLEMAVEDGKIALHTGVRTVRIAPQDIWLQRAPYDEANPHRFTLEGDPYSVPARFVFTLMGHKGDTTFFESIGLCLEAEGRPVHDPATYETNLPGMYVAGSLSGQKIDIILRGREQAAGVVQIIAERLRSQN